MYQLVLVTGKEVKILMASDRRLDVELARERQIRSLSPGMVEIREVKPEKSK